MFKSKWIIFFSLWAAKLVPQYTPEVRVSNGLIRGFYSTDGLYKAYVGIPYATVNKHYRFKAAGPEPLWDGVFDAINENVVCQQIGKLLPIFGQEDCLVLNVYTPPNAAPGERLPVMAYIHGGGFFEGSGHRVVYGPEFLVPKGVILVTMNYRLNIQGFICLGIKEAPGNAGLKDQVQALRWVQRNIAAFGGDPNNVSLFGESAGGVSVSYHLLSSMSKGLFHKAISQSGSSLATWAHQFNPVYLASLLAKTMGYNSMDPYELYNFFMNKTNDDLILTRVPRMVGNTITSELLYSPCTEPVIEGIEPFFTGNPFEELEKGNFNKVPIIIGSNSAEGYLFASMENGTTIEKMKFSLMMPKNLHFPNENEKRAVVEKLERMYMNGSKISNETILKVSKYYGDVYFSYPTFLETELLMKSNDKPVYSYIFGYDGWRNTLKLLLPKQFRNAPGATHADELGYLFMLNWNPLKLPVDLKMVDRMTTLWTNFAKYSDPTPVINDVTPVQWLPMTSSASEVLLIDDEVKVGPMWHNDRVKYWREVYSKYRRKK